MDITISLGAVRLLNHVIIQKTAGPQQGFNMYHNETAVSR